MRNIHRMAVRVSLGTLLAVGASFFLVLVLMRYGMALDARSKQPEMIYPALMYSSDALVEAVADDDLAALVPRVEALQRELGTEVFLVEALPPDLRMLPGGEQGLVLFRNGGVFYVAAPVHGGGFAVAGPAMRAPELPVLMQLLMLAGITSVVGTVGYVLTAPLVRRLALLERAAVRISDGDLDARAEVGGSDAITTLSERFNLMADQVQTLLIGQQALLRAVAHEIRTPIARLRFGGEMLQLAATVEERERRAEELSQDLDELEELVTELMTLSRYSSGARELQPARQGLRQALEPLVQRLSSCVELEVDEALQIDADHRSLHRALRNLMINACRYAASRVVVRAWTEEGSVLVSVEDDGPGLPPEDRDRAFEAFVRLDESRDRGTGGVGLGLTIVQHIMRLHGGEVWVDDSPDLGGARFVTRWPVLDWRQL